MDLYDYSLLTIFIVGVAAVLAATEVGHRLGRRAASRGDDVSTLESAVLGLLALIIAFTFAMALARFEARRDAVLNEANAIGTMACVHACRQTLRNHIPSSVLLMLFGLAAIAAGFMDRPSSGFVKASHQPMIDAAASIAAFPD